jgi:alkylation response protein AidB-like acyl-CoA dehydrogenase
MTTSSKFLATLLTMLADRADKADADPIWPGDSWQLLHEMGAMRWCIPTQYGGDGLKGVDLLANYQELAGACLTTCFILSQRDAAVRRFLDSGNKPLCARFLPSLARGELFATVGLSQLTTSRQHQRPPFLVRIEGDSLILDGFVPWVSGASQAEHLIVGAVLKDGRQALVILPTALPGVTIMPALDLMALQGSLTAEVRCDQVSVDRSYLLAGPVDQVLKARSSGTGGLETSCLALGLAASAVKFFGQEAAMRPPLQSTAQILAENLHKAKAELHRLATGNSSPEEAAALRAWANTLVLETTQAALTVSKGTGFVRPHPAQRWARQALFFLVWSCPWAAASATLDHLTGADTVCQ